MMMMMVVVVVMICGGGGGEIVVSVKNLKLPRAYISVAVKSTLKICLEDNFEHV
jgi:hypothetical protein